MQYFCVVQEVRLELTAAAFGHGLKSRTSLTSLSTIRTVPSPLGYPTINRWLFNATPTNAFAPNIVPQQY